MARLDDRRAASQVHHEEVRVNERAHSSSVRQNPADERRHKIDDVVQRMKERPSGNTRSATETDRSR